jgi:dipeptidase E
VVKGEEHIESRDDRINEFIEVNPGRFVVGLRDGSLLRIENSTIKLIGANGARVFLKGRDAIDYSADESVHFLLTETPSPL